MCNDVGIAMKRKRLVQRRLARRRCSRDVRACNTRAVPSWRDVNRDIRDATTLSSEFYVDARIAELELETVWDDSWLPACLAHDVAGKNTVSECYYLPRGPGHARVFVARDAEGELRAFVNVCSHRAYAVVITIDDEDEDDEATKESRGHGASDRGGRACVTCGYHGWRYAFDGSCVAAPRMNDCRDFDLKEFGLQQLDVIEKGELIFVNLGTTTHARSIDTTASSVPPSSVSSSEGRHATFDAWLGDDPAFVERLTSSGIFDSSCDGLEHVARQEYQIECNWKVFLDNYLDGGYHVPIAHKQLSGGLSLSSYKSYSDTSGNSIQSVDVSGSNARLQGAKPAYVFIYPNIAFNRYGPWLDVNIVTPVSPTRCKVTFEYFLQRDGEGETTRSKFIEESLIESDLVQQEDIALCESVQNGFSHYRPGRYSTLEEPMFQFHKRVYADIMRSTRARSSSSASATLPNLTIDFANQFVDDILDRNARKTATCRSLLHEPHLAKICVGNTVLATHSSGSEVFAALVIIDRTDITFGSISDELARTENFDTKEHMQMVLHSFYPDLQDTSPLVVFAFRVLT